MIWHQPACRLPFVLFFGGALFLALTGTRGLAQSDDRGAAPRQPPAKVAEPASVDEAAKGSGRSTASQGDPYGSLVPVRVMPRVHLQDAPAVTGTFLAPDPVAASNPSTFSKSALMFPRSFELRATTAPESETAKPNGSSPQPVESQAAVPQAAALQGGMPQPAVPQADLPQPAVIAPAVIAPAVPTPVAPEAADPHDAVRQEARPKKAEPRAAMPGRGSVKPQDAAVAQPVRRPPAAKPIIAKPVTVRPTARVAAPTRIEKVRTGPAQAAPRPKPLRRRSEERYDDLPDLVPLPPALQPTTPR